MTSYMYLYQLRFFEKNRFIISILALALKLLLKDKLNLYEFFNTKENTVESFYNLIFSI